MKDLEFLKKITDLPGGSGDEGLVRNLLKEEIEKVCESKIDGFGNILDIEWKKIWNHKDCKKRRKFSSKNSQVCPLGMVK